MKLCAVQPHMADTIIDNVREITRWIRISVQFGADLVVFPEMMLTGYDLHLHELFKDPDWYAQVEEAVDEIGHVVSTSGIIALVGSPYHFEDGILNALLLIQPGRDVILAGARTDLPEAEKNRWGFVAATDRTPIEIQGIAMGSIFCNEAWSLDDTRGKGLEKSDVILWPSGAVNSKKNEQNEITKDNGRVGARKIAKYYGVPVIQTNYISHASEEITQQVESWGYAIGGSVVCDVSGRILDQASRTEEDMLLIDINRCNDNISVTSLRNGRNL